MKQKQSVALAIIITIIVLLGAAVGVGLLIYSYSADQAEEVAKFQEVVRQATATRTEEQRVATVQAQFTATALARPTATPTSASPTLPPADHYLIFNNRNLGFSLQYPGHWQKQEAEDFVVFSPSASGLSLEDYSQVVIIIGRTPENLALPDLLGRYNLPPEHETLNQGNMKLGSQDWQAAQISLIIPEVAGSVTANVAVTDKDGQWYHLLVLAPAGEWRNMQPIFQLILNSFAFVNG